MEIVDFELVVGDRKGHVLAWLVVFTVAGWAIDRLQGLIGECVWKEVLSLSLILQTGTDSGPRLSGEGGGWEENCDRAGDGDGVGGWWCPFPLHRWS